jgi:hypothetical protein
MAARLEIGSAALAELARNPTATVEGRAGAGRFGARIAIPGYRDIIAGHYADVAPGLDAACAATGIEVPLAHFGLVCEFAAATELSLYDTGQSLDDHLRGLVERFGPVVMRNAYLPPGDRAEAQRNIFPDLSFHFDRGANQPTQYSLFFRDPFDPVQAEPRRSSTLHAANIVPHLQLARERGEAPEAIDRRAIYDVFRNRDLTSALGTVLLEHRWDAPRGTGEIAVLFNRTVLHSSYYRPPRTKGYPISVRYLC